MPRPVRSAGTVFSHVVATAVSLGRKHRAKHDCRIVAFRSAKEAFGSDFREAKRNIFASHEVTAGYTLGHKSQENSYAPQQGLTEIATIEEAHRTLEPLLGRAASWVFAISLLAAAEFHTKETVMARKSKAAFTCPICQQLKPLADVMPKNNRTP